MFSNRCSILAVTAILALSLCACGSSDTAEQPQEEAQQPETVQAAAPTAEGLADVLSSVVSADYTLSTFEAVETEQGPGYAASVIKASGSSFVNPSTGVEGTLIAGGQKLPFWFESYGTPYPLNDYAPAAIEYLSPGMAGEVWAYLCELPDLGTYRCYDAGGYRYFNSFNADGLNSVFTIFAMDGNNFQDYQEGKQRVKQVEA